MEVIDLQCFMTEIEGYNKYILFDTRTAFGNVTTYLNDEIEIVFKNKGQLAAYKFSHKFDTIMDLEDYTMAKTQSIENQTSYFLKDVTIYRVKVKRASTQEEFYKKVALPRSYSTSEMICQHLTEFFQESCFEWIDFQELVHFDELII
ncbi:hypothetical protein [Candidatus Enterococcus courvalinii]|uniref:Uncharacterized protein n=1 Tax=Candidatus Enterococcus courvalinii TaxID=2815329 RepID=A0ABS3I1C3_9ENTE|nr:hypothetical protein [Enterococcus sp. MSG2901]MBO0482519.1 hypothetical protein [Enterococcus sp. MSG2901]